MQDADTPAAAEIEAEDLYSPEPADNDGGAEPGKEEGDEQPRDEQGRFAPKAKADDADKDGPGEERKPEAAKAEADEPDKRHYIPLGEHLSEREKRQAAERRAEEAERRWEAFQRQQQVLQRQQREAEEAPQRPDPITDPEGYDAYIEQRLVARERAIVEQFRVDRLNASFADLEENMIAEGKGEVFTKAFTALQAAPQYVKDEVFEAVNPARAMMRWYQDLTARQEIGGDLDGYMKRKQDEWAKDPEVRKRILAEMEAEARGGSGERSPTVVSLPSLSRAPGGTAHRGDAEEMDTESLYTPVRGRR